MYLKIIVTSIVLIFWTCNKPPCICDFAERRGIDCKIVDNLGNDLVMGPSPRFKLDSLFVLAKAGNLSVHNASVRKAYPDSSLIAFNYYNVQSKSYIYYGQAIVQDSIEIDWLTKYGKCCGEPQEYFTVGSVKFNSRIITPQNGVYYFIK